MRLLENVVGVVAGQSAAKCAAILARIAGSGRGPAAAPRLSAACAGLRVPGMTQVTAGSARIHLSENWAQLSQPMSLTQSGRATPLVRRNSAPSANGRFTITAVRVSAATRIRRDDASGSTSE